MSHIIWVTVRYFNFIFQDPVPSSLSCDLNSKTMAMNINNNNSGGVNSNSMVNNLIAAGGNHGWPASVTLALNAVSNVQPLLVNNPTMQHQIMLAAVSSAANNMLAPNLNNLNTTTTSAGNYYNDPAILMQGPLMNPPPDADRSPSVPL